MEAENRTAKKAKSELSSRDLIMSATLRLIAQEGIDAVTHRRVAEIAGVSPGTTTHHFAGRKRSPARVFHQLLKFRRHALYDVLRNGGPGWAHGC